MLAKGVHLIQFENCNFFQLLKWELPTQKLLRGTPPEAPAF